MSKDSEERKRDDRRAWLGDPIEHGGEYRPARPPKGAPEIGCCLFEAAGSLAVLLALAALSSQLFLR